MHKILIVFVFAVPLLASCSAATKADIDSTLHAGNHDNLRLREEREDDSLMALRKTFNALRFTAGLGNNSFGGFSGMLTASFQHNHYLFSGLYNLSGNYMGGADIPAEASGDVGLMLGYASINAHSFLSASAGIGYSIHEFDGDLVDTSVHGVFVQHEKHGITVPVQLQGMLTFSNYFGMGITLFGIFAPSSSPPRSSLFNYGGGLTFQIGLWPVIAPEVGEEDERHKSERTTSLPVQNISRDSTRADLQRALADPSREVYLYDLNDKKYGPITAFRDGRFRVWDTPMRVPLDSVASLNEEHHSGWTGALIGGAFSVCCAALLYALHQTDAFEGMLYSPIITVPFGFFLGNTASSGESWPIELLK